MQPFFIAPFGYLAGTALSLFIPEEVGDGSGYFRIGHAVLALMVLAAAFMSQGVVGIIAVVLLVSGSVALSFRKKTKTAFFLMIVSSVFLKPVSSMEVEIAISILVFVDGLLLSGMESGRIFQSSKEKGKEKDIEVSANKVKSEALRKLPQDIVLLVLAEAFVLATTVA